MLPEEAPKLALTNAQSFGQRVDRLAVECTLANEGQGS
jgi:hypothetical protein